MRQSVDCRSRHTGHATHSADKQWRGSSRCDTAQRWPMRTGTGDEAEGVVAGLHVLPEVDVLVVEDVAVLVQVVEALRAEHHADVVAAVHHGHHLQEEGRVRDLSLESKTAQ